MTRRQLREHIFKLLFRIEFNKEEEMPEQLRFYFEALEDLDEKDHLYMEEKFGKILKNIENIDMQINQVSEGWKTDRMAKVDLTILRLALYEMKYDETIPLGVAINEAVEISKKFGGDDSPAFVNGILAKLT